MTVLSTLASFEKIREDGEGRGVDGGEHSGPRIHLPQWRSAVQRRTEVAGAAHQRTFAGWVTCTVPLPIPWQPRPFPTAQIPWNLKWEIQIVCRVGTGQEVQTTAWPGANGNQAGSISAISVVAERFSIRAQISRSVQNDAGSTRGAVEVLQAGLQRTPFGIVRRLRRRATS